MTADSTHETDASTEPTDSNSELDVEKSTHHRVDPEAESMTGRYALMKLPAGADAPTDYQVTNFFTDEATAWEQAQLAVSDPEPRAAMAWVLDVKGAFVQSAQDHLDHGVAADGTAAPDSITIPLPHTLEKDSV